MDDIQEGVETSRLDYLMDYYLAGSNDTSLLTGDRLPVEHHGMRIGWAVETSPKAWRKVPDKAPKPTWWNREGNRIEVLWLSYKPILLTGRDPDTGSFTSSEFASRQVDVALFNLVSSFDKRTTKLLDVSSSFSKGIGHYGPMWITSALRKNMQFNNLWDQWERQPPKPVKWTPQQKARFEAAKAKAVARRAARLTN